MAEQVPLAYDDEFRRMFEAAERAEAERRLRQFTGTDAEALARSADSEAARVSGRAARDVVGRQAGVGAIEGMASRSVRGLPSGGPIPEAIPTSPGITGYGATGVASTDLPTPFTDRPTSPGVNIFGETGVAGTEPATPFTERPTSPGVRGFGATGVPGTEPATSFMERGTTPGVTAERQLRVRAREAGPRPYSRPARPAPATPAAPATAPTAPTVAPAVAEEGASMLSRARSGLRTLGEVASAGFKSPVARGFANPLTALATGAMEVEKYFDPRGKTFTDDIEMMHENINRIRSGARGSSSKPSPISYMDIRGRDDMPSNYRGTVISGGGGSDMGTKTGGASAKERLTSVGGVPEVQDLIERGLLDDNFIKEAVSDMTEQERADMFTRNLRLPPDDFKVVYEALGGDAAAGSIEDYKNYAVNSLPAAMGEDGDVIRQQNMRALERLMSAGALPKKVSESPEAPAAAEMPEAPAAEAPKAPAAKAPRAAKSEGVRVLRVGDRSGETMNVQQRLQQLGYDIGAEGADGIFGTDTKKAVEAFQKDQKLDVDGAVGQDTYKALTKVFEERGMADAPAGDDAAMMGEARPDGAARALETSPERFARDAFSETDVEELREIDPRIGTGRMQGMSGDIYDREMMEETIRPSAFPIFRRR